MRRSKCISQVLSVAIALLGALTAMPAFAQCAFPCADVFLDLNNTDSSGAIPRINWGGTQDLDIAVINLGPNYADNVKLHGSIVTPNQLNARFVGADPTCVIADAGANFDCVLGRILESTQLPSNPDGGAPAFAFTNTVDTIVTVGIRSYPFDGGTVCPAAVPVPDITVTATTTSHDPDGGNNTDTFSNGIRTQPLADLAVSMTAPAGANQGDTITETTTVTNRGPCPANRVRLRNTRPQSLIFVSNSGDCTAAFGTGCIFSGGPVPAGVSKTVNTMYMVDSFPGTLANTGEANTMIVDSTATPNPDAGANLARATFDPNTGNNSTTQSVAVSNDLGCNLTGAAPWFGLVGMGLLVAAFGRRLRRRS